MPHFDEGFRRRPRDHGAGIDFDPGLMKPGFTHQILDRLVIRGPRDLPP